MTQKPMFFCYILLSAVLSSAGSAQWMQTNGPCMVQPYSLAILPNEAGGDDLFVLGEVVYQSTDNGASWIRTAPGSGYFCTSLTAIDTTLYVSNAGGYAWSTDRGVSWSSKFLDPSQPNTNSIFQANGTLFAATDRGIYRSTDQGTNWSPVNTGLMTNWVWGFNAIGSTVFAATREGGVFRSTDNGTTWYSAIAGLKNLDVRSLCVFGTTLFAGTFGGGVFRSTNGGNLWQPANSGLADLTLWTLLQYTDSLGRSTLYAGTQSEGVFLYGGVYRPTDSGTTWESISAGIPSAPVLSLAHSRRHLYAGAAFIGVFRSTDDGGHWDSETTGGLHLPSIYHLAGFGTELYAGLSYAGVFRSTDRGTRWKSASLGLAPAEMSLIAAADGIVFVTLQGYGPAEAYGLFRSTDHGDSWISSKTGLPPGMLPTFVGASGSTLFTGSPVGLFQSSDRGATWTSVYPGLNATCFASNGEWAFVGTDGSGVYRSTDRGVTWAPSNNGLSNLSISRLSLASGIQDSQLFAGTNGSGIFMSADLGDHWTQTSVKSGQVNSLATTVTQQGVIYLFAETWDGLWNSIIAAENITYGWHDYSDWRLGSSQLVVSGADLFVGGDGVWRRSLSEMTSVDEPAGQVPARFALEQNYPNPFNPETRIKYTIGGNRGEGVGGSDVSLVVYDVLGRQVATLVDEPKAPGNYEVTFDGSGLASGVYIYRMTAGTYTESRKMVLVR